MDEKALSGLQARMEINDGKLENSLMIMYHLFNKKINDGKLPIELASERLVSFYTSLMKNKKVARKAAGKKPFDEDEDGPYDHKLMGSSNYLLEDYS
ncbi:hypothetical protein MTR_8g023000 [Medicago truncatula]|uniref:Uncharacterized protein n=1 Tax=Medicago truncatula TaxID=3880 RepID=G7L958_MEDTR|nr:hypothetical protein MTR_8g023000 [Medicago truncatula]